MKSWSSRLLVIAAVAGVAGCATWARWTHKAEPAAAPAPPPEARAAHVMLAPGEIKWRPFPPGGAGAKLAELSGDRSEEHTSELQSQSNLVCRLLLEKKKKET